MWRCKFGSTKSHLEGQETNSKSQERRQVFPATARWAALDLGTEKSGREGVRAVPRKQRPGRALAGAGRGQVQRPDATKMQTVKRDDKADTSESTARP